MLAYATLTDNDRGVAIQLLDESVLLPAERAVCEGSVRALALLGWIRCNIHVAQEVHIPYSRLRERALLSV